MTMLSYLSGIIRDRSINATGHENNVVDSLNANVKNYLKKQLELVEKLPSNESSKIRMLPSTSSSVSFILSEKTLQILTNIDRLNRIKVITKMHKIESLFK